MSILKFSAAYVHGAWLKPCFAQLDEAGRLLSLGQEAPAGSAEKIDERGGYLLPGMSNGHSHSFQYAMAGMSESLEPGLESDSFWTWRKHLYRIANRITPEQLLAISSQFYMALLEEGFTGVAEFHYLHHDRNGRPYAQPHHISAILMEAAAEAGIRLSLIPIYYQQAAPGQPLREEQRRFGSADVDSYLHLLEQIATYARSRHTDVIVGYGVHSMRAASLADIKTILGAHWTPGPAHVHVSEQAEDARSFESNYGSRAIDWLFDNVALDIHHHLVHATHINGVELRKLAASGATVVLCPTTEANLGDGIFPLPEFHHLSGSWCVGTDSHVNLSPFVEMRSLELTHRLLMEKRNILCQEPEGLDSGTLIFDRVLAGGRRTLGLKPEPFALGEPFEGIVLDSEHDRLLERPLDKVLGILTFTGERSMIREVYAKGERQVTGGQHRKKAGLREPYRLALQQLFES